jgi:WD40 repeat protein
MSLDGLARATCAVYVDGHRDGSGTLVTGTHVLTAAHVLRRSGPVAIRFRDGLSREDIPVTQVPLGPDADSLDIAVLEVRSGPDIPPPAVLWPAKRLPSETKAYGYPVQEGVVPRGVWRDSVVGGAVQGGRVQLDWHDTGTLVGHSGGPVGDKVSGLMVGVLVEGAKAGHFDRMVTLAAARSAWDGLPRPWLFAGENARAHFTQRAKGQRSIASGGDIFQGRREALEVVRNWLFTDTGPGVPLVITAQPGAGKSAVLARAAVDMERTWPSDGIAFHARSAAVIDLVDAVAAACGLDTPSSWQELIAVLAEREVQDVLILAVDALDEAASEQDRAQLRQVLRELARLSWFRVVVATRPLAARDAYGPGTHLHALGVIGGSNSRNLVDLDTDRFFSAEDLIAYADVLLGQLGVTNPGPPGKAWQFYQENPSARGMLANVVASRADRNYLVTGMSAFQLAEDDTVHDPTSATFNPTVIPRGIGEALSKHFDRLPVQRRWREVGLLTALAYGRGAGLDDQRWLAFTRALGDTDVTIADLAELKASAAADYLLEGSTEAGEQVTRLFHQALADELIVRRNRHDDEARLVQLLLTEGGDRRWLSCSRYSRDYVPSHAAEAGRLESLLSEADFLVSMTPTAMRAAVAGLRRSDRRDPASIYEISLPFLDNNPEVNAAVLEFISQTQGNQALSKKLSNLRVKKPYKIIGNIRPFDLSLARFDGHTASVTGVAALGWRGLDHPVVVTTSMDGTARVWDPRDPSRELARFDGHASGVFGVAALGWPGLDHPVVVTTSSDRTARVWDPRDPSRELARFDGHAGGVVGVAALGWPGLDHPVVVTTSSDRTARVWDPRKPHRELARFDGHTANVMGVAALAWRERDHPVVATASLDGTARVWDSRKPQRELARFNGHGGPLFGVATLDWPGVDHPVVVTTSVDGTARVWDPRDPSRELACLPLFGESLSCVVLTRKTFAFASFRGLVIFELRKKIFQLDAFS